MEFEPLRLISSLSHKSSVKHIHHFLSFLQGVENQQKLVKRSFFGPSIKRKKRK